MITARPACHVLLSLVLAVACAAAQPAGQGAVVSADPIASGVGTDILSRGGNAADAAVATALALAVTFPEAGNLGGGGFAVVKFGDEVRALDFREVAPAAATADMYLDARGEPIPGASLVGALAAGVPGSAPGLHELHRRHGRLPWREVVEPAVALARDGFSVSQRLARAIAEQRELLQRFPETAAVFLPGGEPLRYEAQLVQPDLARTLERLARRGPAGVMRGPVARAVVAASETHGGILTERDLARQRPRWREPVRFSVGEWTVASMPLPSSGGTILGVVAGLLDRLGWAALDRQGADRAHLFAESCRVAFAARRLMGDPESSAITPGELLDPAWLDAQAARIDRERARSSADVGVPDPGDASREKPDTTHLSVVDFDGNAVALTTTLNGAFGSGLLVAGAGFLLNNEMDDFTTAPGRPNMFGLIQGEANAVAPGRRMLSSMSPTIAWRGREIVVVGSPGGSRIPTATLQVLLAMIVDGDDARRAVDRPRLHHQWLPDELLAERTALAPEARAELERRGHVVKDTARVGEVEAVRWAPDRVVQAAADGRVADTAAFLADPPPRARPRAGLGR